MKRIRYIVDHILPGFWRRRIDLENESIRSFLSDCALKMPKGLLVLDAGAGRSPYQVLFNNQRYIAVDFAKGEQSWNYSGLDSVARLEALPFADSIFDVVISTQVLEHVPAPLLVLKEMKRILKPGGELLLTAPLGFGEHQQPYDFFRFTRFGLRHLLSEAGFTVISIEPRGGYFRYLAVMLMWIYLYLFPESRSVWIRCLLTPLQLIAALIFIFLAPPVISSLDFLDKERTITLGFSVVAQKNGSDSRYDFT